MIETDIIKLRPLEREDLRFVHHLNNNANVMRYWFEEPYETFAELSALYEEHIHKQSERRFIVAEHASNVGLVELVEINYVHRSAEFQIIITPEHQGKGLALGSTKLALDYGFSVLNLHKIYLIVDRENDKAAHIYAKAGFRVEGVLMEEFFMNGEYRDVTRMCIFQRDHLPRSRKNGEADKQRVEKKTYASSTNTLAHPASHESSKTSEQKEAPCLLTSPYRWQSLRK